MAITRRGLGRAALALGMVALPSAAGARESTLDRLVRGGLSGLPQGPAPREGVAAEPRWRPGFEPWRGRTGHLVLSNAHTGETLDVRYKDAAGYRHDALARIDRLMRDWRTGTVQPIDPAVLDILSAVQAGLEHRRLVILSAYRTRRTNRMLARRHPGRVAEESLHLSGRAVDFHVPGVPIVRARDTALALEAGGVGYYPRNGFLHVDTGRRRVWRG